MRAKCISKSTSRFIKAQNISRESESDASRVSHCTEMSLTKTGNESEKETYYDFEFLLMRSRLCQEILEAVLQLPGKGRLGH
jgi:hypothetical protein